MIWMHGTMAYCWFDDQTGVSELRLLSSVGDVWADGFVEGNGVGPSILIVMPELQFEN